MVSVNEARKKYCVLLSVSMTCLLSAHPADQILIRASFNGRFRLTLSGYDAKEKSSMDILFLRLMMIVPQGHFIAYNNFG